MKWRPTGLESTVKLAELYRLAAINTLHLQQQVLAGQGSGILPQTYDFIRQGLEAERAQGLMEGLRIRKLFLGMRRLSLAGALARGPDVSDGQIDQMLGRDAHGRLTLAKEMTQQTMAMDDGPYIGGRIAALYDFLAKARQLLDLAKQTQMGSAEAKAKARAAFSAFVSSALPVPDPAQMRPSVRISQGQGQAWAQMTYWIDDPYGEQTQRASFIRRELDSVVTRYWPRLRYT